MIRNTYYPPRQLKQLIPDDIKVINFGLSSSGSTFIYQILCDLYREGVIKTHSFYSSPRKVKVIATMRDFRDCVVSWHRRWFPETTALSDEAIKETGKKILSEIESLRKYLVGHNCRLLRYEEFTTNPDVAFDAIEDLFDIRLPPSERTKMAEKHSIEANRKIAEVMSSFSQYDEESQIHGNHIHEGESVWEQFVPNQDLINNIFGEALKEFKYL